jgi:hypothetical protein
MDCREWWIMTTLRWNKGCISVQPVNQGQGCSARVVPAKTNFALCQDFFSTLGSFQARLLGRSQVSDDCGIYLETWRFGGGRRVVGPAPVKLHRHMYNY